MKKLLVIILSLFFMQSCFAFENVVIPTNNNFSSYNDKPQVVTGSVSLLDSVPNGFYGTWKVFSVVVEATDPFLFNNTGIDMWKLERVNNFLILTNPESGATATVTLDTVDGNTIKFIRKSDTPYEKVTEIPQITLNGENFYGIDTLLIQKNKDGAYSKEIIKFRIKGIKQSGASVNDLIVK